MSDPAWIDGKHLPEPSVEFEYPGDANTPAPVETASSERLEILRYVFGMLGNGGPKERFIRFTAWSKALGYEEASLRVLAAEVGISIGAFHAKIKEARATLNGVSLRKGAKK